MLSNVNIRIEIADDINAIESVTISAFRELQISQHTEQYIINALRKSQVLTLSLVAEYEKSVIGHIAFSPVTITDGSKGWYGLGPVSVLPNYQRQGIGKRLINEGLARLKKMNAKGCCLVGHPEYYKQFGFRNVDNLSIEGVPPAVFFAISFEEKIPQGKICFHDAFKATS